MTPYTFTAKDSRNASSRMTLRFTGRRIFPSLLLTNFLGISAGAHVAFMVNEDAPEQIFIRKAEDDEVYTSSVSNHCLDEGKLSMSSSAVVNHILLLTGESTSVTCYVAAKPTMVDGKKYYRILTDKPIKK